MSDNDLIRRGDALKEIERFAGYLDDDMILRLKIAIRRIKPVPSSIATADVVPVVRCKDCKYIHHLPWLDDETGRAVICTKHSFTGLRSDEWYCADGEEKEGR